MTSQTCMFTLTPAHRSSSHRHCPSFSSTARRAAPSSSPLPGRRAGWRGGVTRKWLVVLVCGTPDQGTGCFHGGGGDCSQPASLAPRSLQRCSGASLERGVVVVPQSELRCRLRCPLAGAPTDGMLPWLVLPPETERICLDACRLRRHAWVDGGQVQVPAWDGNSPRLD